MDQFRLEQTNSWGERREEERIGEKRERREAIEEPDRSKFEG